MQAGEMLRANALRPPRKPPCRDADVPLFEDVA
jgi:hypothetical protein